MKRTRNDISSRHWTLAKSIRWWRIASGVVSVLALVGGVAVLSALLSPPAPVSLVAVGADYATNLSVRHNARGWRGLIDVCELSSEASPHPSATSLTRAVGDPIVADSQFTWAEAIKRMSGRAAVLVVSLHGGADKEGPYLRRIDCQPSDASTEVLRVADLLAELQKLPPEHPKLVVFDATGSPGEWRYGESENGFAEGLRLLSGEIAKVPELVVISASDTGEQSWPAAQTGRTAFLKAFVEGLRGGAADTDSDGRLSVAEVLDSIQRRVGRDVMAEFHRTQTPLLLPLGDEGDRRASRFDLAFANPQYRLPGRPTPVIQRTELLANWETSARLATELCRPETTATVAWRRYRGLIVRREQLLVADAADAAQRVAEELRDLELRLGHDAREGAGAFDPVELGRPAPNGSLVALAEKTFAQLWQASGADQVAIAAKVFAATPEADRPKLRRLLFDHVINCVSDDPQKALRPGAELIEALRDPLAPLPGDIHLVSVLSSGLPEDLADGSWRAALRLAIETRSRSESLFVSLDPADQVFTPQLAEWVHTRCVEADGQRLLGEDLLFAGVSHLPEAIRLLSDAKNRYETLRGDAELVRRALRVRDAALHLVPYYVQATESLHATSSSTAEEISRLTMLTEAACRDVHKLANTLLDVSRGVESPTAALAHLSEQADLVESAVASLHGGFREWRTKLLTRSGCPLELNREAVLLTPDIDPSERLRLLASIGATSQVDALKQHGPVSQAKEEAAWRREEKLRRARLALADVGERAFDRFSEVRLAHQKAVAELTSAAESGDQSGPTDKGSGGLVATCAALRSEALELAGLIVAVATDAHADQIHRKQVIETAEAVRRFARGQAPLSEPALLSEVQRVKQYDYYCWRAERAINSLWADSDSGAFPYGQAVALDYMKEADRCVPGRESTDDLRSAARRSFDLALKVPDAIDLLSSASSVARVGVMAGDSPLGGAPQGVAALTVEASKGFTLVTPPHAQRQAVPLESMSATGEPTIVVGLDEGVDSSPLSGNLEVVGWFRGRRTRALVPLRNHIVPTVEMVSAPRPAGAGVAIDDLQTDSDAASAGAIALVLDASGSMGPGANPDSKFNQATATLNSLLRDLPGGVTLSVWVFGQAVGPSKTTDTPEATIARVLEPTRWDPSDAELATEIARRVAYPRVEPWNESPLTRAILMACRDLRGANGYKSVIAITDGVDNRFALDTYANPQGRSIHEAVESELRGTGVSLQIIGYRVADPEQEAARRQFRFLGQLTPSGRWWEADQADDLERALLGALQASRTASLYLEGGQPHEHAAGIATINPRNQPSVWPTEPMPEGVYDLPRLASDAASQKALLADGDLLLLSTRRDAAGLHLAPASYALSRHPTRPAIAASDWRVAVLNDRRLVGGGRTALIALERTVAADAQAAPVLQVERPKFLWIEGAEGRSAPLSWRRVDGYPAPCWEAEWSRGQAGPNDSFTVWWSWPERPAPAVALRRDDREQRVSDFVGETWNIDGNPVTLRRVAVEERRLPDATGRGVVQKCVVVELRGAPRCIVKLHGCEAQGERQQWFDDVQSSVAIFWPVNPGILENGIEGLDIASVAAMQQQAEASGQVARFVNASHPTPDDHRPIPAVDWFIPVESDLATDAQFSQRSGR